jgi:hypothetical protein
MMKLRAWNILKWISVNLLAWFSAMGFFFLIAALVGKIPLNYFRLSDFFSFILFYGPIVYFNSLYLMPRYLLKHKYLSYAGLLILAVGAFLPVQNYLLEWSDPQKQEIPLADNLFVIIICLFIGTIIRLVANSYNQQKKIIQLETEFLKTELDVLKNQINPHFLFNTLNVLYAQILEQSPHAKDVVIKLSEILRYGIYGSKKQYVPLESELQYIRQYIDLQSLRINHHDKLKINISIDEPTKKLQLAPLILIVFIENAFKHGSIVTDREPFICLDISVNDKNLVYSLTNQFNPDETNISAGGIGLENVRKRLKLLYTDKFELVLTPGRNIYSVLLKMPLNEAELSYR